MATLDLNQEPDVEDVEVLPDLNEALVGDDHFDDAHGGDENQNVNQGDDEATGTHDTIITDFT